MSTNCQLAAPPAPPVPYAYDFNGVFLQRDAKVHLNLNWPTVYLELS